jgi:hypothetical protein
VKKSFSDKTSIFVMAGVAVLFTLFAGIKNIQGGVVDQILDADYEALEQPLVPEMGGYEPAKLSSKLGYVWTLPDKTQAMVLLGDFTLQMPHQKLSSRDAVVWLRVVDREGQRVKQLDVFMEGGAKIVETSGILPSDPNLTATPSFSGRKEFISCNPPVRAEKRWKSGPPTPSSS